MKELLCVIVMVGFTIWLSSCATPDQFRMSDGISQRDAAGMATMMGTIGK